MPPKTIVVLGAGVGGLETAHQLRRRLPKEHKVVLVDRKESQSFCFTYPWLMLGQREAQGISMPLAGISRKGILFIRAEVSSIDVSQGKVKAGSVELGYDYLVIALGADYQWDAVPGFSAIGNSFYHIEWAAKLRKQLEGFPGGEVALVILGTPYKCPPAPYEGAMLLEQFFRTRGIRQHVNIQVYSPDLMPMPVAGEQVGNEVRSLLSERQITFNGGFKAAIVEPGKREVVFANAHKAPFDLLIGVPVHKAPDVVQEAGLVGETGWIPVDPSTLMTRYGNVYAIGDVASVRLPSGPLLPKAGVFALGQGKTVAHSIARDILGGPPPQVYDGKGQCYIEVGAGKAGLIKASFFRQPKPRVDFVEPTEEAHLQKLLTEKHWLWRWF